MKLIIVFYFPKSFLEKENMQCRWEKWD